MPSRPQSLLKTKKKEEEEEEEEDENQNIRNINKALRSGPTFTVTKEKSSADSNNKSRPGSGDYGEALPLEDTDTPDGLRNYLQRMISAGMLPGGSDGPPDLSEVFSDDER